MTEKKVSIIMPVYNAAQYLDQTIESILNQTYKNFELIIIDDSSTDASYTIAETWAKKDLRILIVKNKYTKGIHGASNTGLDTAQGAYIAKADADDIQRPYRLETQIKFLESHTDVDIVGGGYELFGNGTDGTKIHHPSNSLKLAWKFISDIYFCNPTVTFRRCVLTTIPHYPEVPCEDYAFLSRAIKKHKGINIEKILIDYRQHNSNYSNTAKENINKSVLKIFEENFIYYTGSLKDADIFYAFHKQQNLKLKHLFIVIKKSLLITKKIAHQYDSKNIFIKYIYLFIIIKIAIIKALFRPLLRKLYKKIKN